MQRDSLNFVDGFTGMPRRSKRLNDNSEVAIVSIKSVSPMKKHRGVRLTTDSNSDISDKENFHRSSRLAPRSRLARILAELFLDVPTDASDFEVSDNEDALDAPLGILFNQQVLRVNDAHSERHNFKIFEDSL